MRPGGQLVLVSMLVALSAQVVSAQESNGMIPGFQAAIHFGAQAPTGPLAERYGISNTVGFAMQRITSNGWRFGAHYRFQTGSDVREPGLLDNLRDPNGHIVDNEGRIALVTAQQRGTLLFMTAGRQWRAEMLSSGSKVFAELGIGFWEHKIHFQNRGNRLTQLDEPHIAGYDRLTGGGALIARLGYLHDAPNGLIRFQCGVEAIQGRLQPNRAWNTDTMSSDTGPRSDGTIGLFAAWILRLQARSTDVDFYH